MLRRYLISTITLYNLDASWVLRHIQDIFFTMCIGEWNKTSTTPDVEISDQF
jgi:hypothetical protein